MGRRSLRTGDLVKFLGGRRALWNVPQYVNDLVGAEEVICYSTLGTIIGHTQVIKDKNLKTINVFLVLDTATAKAGWISTRAIQRVE